jgi:hypothetical protein
LLPLQEIVANPTKKATVTANDFIFELIIFDLSIV